MNVIDVYKKQIKDFFNFDDRTLTALTVEADRNSKLSLLMRHPYMLHSVLSIVTRLIYPLMGIRSKVKIDNEDFVFVSCVDPVFRTKNLGLITGDLSFCIIHQPNFHIKQTIKYHRYFVSQNIKAFFPTIRLQDIFKARNQIRQFEKTIGISKGLDDYQVIRSVLSFFLIYSNIVKEYLKGSDDFNGKWVLEHQIYYFIPVIYNLRATGKDTTMLQHGLFFKPTTDFFPLNCDEVLCCSEREKNIYLREGVEEKRVKVLGIPIQTIHRFANTKPVTRDEKHYNLLLLLTVVTEANAHLIKDILSYIRGKYDKVLLRFRPRSRDDDMRLLGESVHEFTISDFSHTIDEDLYNSKRVISFSADAIVEVVKVGRPFLYIWLKEDNDYIKDIQCATMDDYKEQIDKLMNSDCLTNKMQTMAKELVGEQDVSVIRKKFVEYIRER